MKTRAMIETRRVLVLVGGLWLAACAPKTIVYPTTMDMTTWSVVGIDPKPEIVAELRPLLLPPLERARTGEPFTARWNPGGPWS